MTDTLRSIVESWKVERDAKCEDCKNGLVLGRHGCHFMDDGEESYSTGNCKAWPLSLRIQQMEACAAELETWLAVNLERIKLDAVIQSALGQNEAQAKEKP